ncbi:MAG: ABC transporter permease [Gammaproteobacteria bacterium]|nr:ABC transporter permease [Gammaproteobacteria bacterium]MBU1601703.1 ABC transporter permease [Gammaproteobacteria bacterium]MBU2434782.1 ABC transporter permease [Gammaproteobacteria bacterium]MBU2448023.1 ABC transporter permease [Gammaproteobacteria bacterium]
MSTSPRLLVEPGRVVLSGCWTLAEMLPQLPALEAELVACAGHNEWDLSAISRLDSAAAVLLWRTWGARWPVGLVADDLHRQVLERVADLPLEIAEQARPRRRFPEMVGALLLKAVGNLRGMIALFGQLLLDVAYLVRHPQDVPWKEFTANVYKAGAQALAVTALVGFLIGVTISYLSALQLKSFGADLFIVNILGISIIRELGPVLVAVLVAGRSGSAMTAQIGVMRVTEEIDVLSTMGISRTIRVVLPKIFGLTVAMPLLVLWTSAVALFGGMLAALLQLDLSFAYFVDNLPRAVPVANLVIGLSKGVVFGFVIAIVACHFGLHVKPNTESLSASTTSAVVTAITTVILFDAIFAVFTRNIGVP